MAAISKQNWGLIMAKAYLDSSFRNLLQKDPLAAATKFKNETPGFPDFDVLYNFAEFDLGTGLDNFHHLKLSNPHELDRIINKERTRPLKVSELRRKPDSSTQPSMKK